ncbi:MAG TPA: VCBS repeat-containing protein [Candidatus Limnocylindria bacterium]|nr:VCBS repeat-containing protein [Candidatus Limnocylindria bacterium]
MPVALLLAFEASALDWKPGAGYRVAALPVPATGGTGFTLLNPADLGIDFSNFLAEARAQQFQNLMNGSGLAAADFDGDGLVDLYFTHKQAANQLYRNLGGWKFTNVTAASGTACTNLSSTGALAGDLNGDGAPDLVVSSFGGPHACLLNDGKGHFTDVTAAAGIAGTSGGTSMALADVDGDGDLDLYLCNFAVQAILRDGGVVTSRIVNGKAVVTGRYAKRVKIENGRMYELGDPDVLFLNDGQGHFTPAPWNQNFTDAEGRPVAPPADLGLAVQIRDVNGDGFPDIYVCNDFQTLDHLWFGDGKGHFREASLWTQRNMSYGSMGVDFADLDRDGRMDFVTVEMLDPDLGDHLRGISPTVPVNRLPGRFAYREEFARNCLYHQRGDGTFAEIADFAGVAATGWSWGAMFLDVDLDGWEDLLVSNGYMHDVNNRDISALSHARSNQEIQSTKDTLFMFPPLKPPKAAFRNRHDLTFETVSTAWGFDSTRVAYGMIAADLDGDGDLDVVLNCLEGPPLIYRNDTIAPRVAVRLKGRSPNTAGIGAKITLTGGPVTQTQEVIGGGPYLSCSDPMRVFAAGRGENLTLEVTWRSGRRSVVRGVQANSLYEVDEAAAESGGGGAGRVEARPGPLFTDATAKLAHTHLDEAFDDFGQQPLLHRRLSTLGPQTLVADVNGDGHDDLVIGGARSGQIAVKLGDGTGGFADLELPGGTLPDDVIGLAWLPGAPGHGSLLAALASYESGDTNQPSVLRWDFVGGKPQAAPPLPALGGSPAALALGDVDGDGHADLFVGGRVTPRRWPEPPVSQLFRNESGQFVVDAANTRALAGAGLVTGAAFADLDGDRQTDLVLATEFGPVRIYRNQAGKLAAWDPPVSFGAAQTTLGHFTGWWNCVAVADVNGDGRPDIIAGNWGRNSNWQVWGDGLPRVTYGDLNGDGVVTAVEAVRVGGRVMPWRYRDTLVAGLPDLAARYPKNAAFSEATLAGIFGVPAGKTHELAVTTLASMVFLNRGDHFDAAELPAEAQWSCANAIVVADADGDGRPDLFLAQNCFSVRPDDLCLDSGRGLWLRGDGNGGFAPIPGEESGVIVYGEQRGAALGDFNGDGKPDLVVTQNGTATRLFLGTRGKVSAK